MPLSYKDIAEIIKIIDASDCEELVVELDGARLEVRRHGAGGQARAAYADGETRAEGSAAAFEAGAAGPRAATDPAAASAPRTDGAALAGNRVAVRAPMVGTFYRTPDPQAPPYVEVGDNVKPGDPLGLIEVMKLYTTIEAEVAGRIAEIAVETATMVEHDQVLFVIEPA